MSSRLLLIDNKEGISPRDCSATVTALPGRVCSLTDIISNFAEDGEGRRGTCCFLAVTIVQRDTTGHNVYNSSPRLCFDVLAFLFLHLVRPYKNEQLTELSPMCPPRWNVRMTWR